MYNFFNVCSRNSDYDTPETKIRIVHILYNCAYADSSTIELNEELM
jgi:hypothetical protein